MKETSVYARTRVRSGEKAAATTEISKAGMYTLAVVSTLIGIWGFACFVGGLVASGGPLSFVGNWFKAVGGM